MRNMGTSDELMDDGVKPGRDALLSHVSPVINVTASSLSIVTLRMQVKILRIHPRLK